MTATDTAPKFLTVDQAAKRLQMSTKTVRRRIADGSIKASRLGRLLRILEEDLLEFMGKEAEPKRIEPKNPKLRLIKKSGKK